jgi:hypothetical protein
VSDWSRIPAQQLSKRGGLGLLKLYGGSVAATVRDIFQEEENFQEDSLLLTWKNAPPDHWEDPNNLRSYFDWVAEKLNVDLLENWMEISGKKLIEMGEGGPLKHDKEKNWMEFLIMAYPDTIRFHGYDDFYEEDQLDALIPTKNPWIRLENRERFFERVSQEIGIKNPSEWYEVRWIDIDRLGGSYLLKNYHNNSLWNALNTLYGEYHWNRWRFKHFQGNNNIIIDYIYCDILFLIEDWNSIQLHLELFEFMGKALDIKEDYDWLRVNKSHVEYYGGSHILKVLII